MTAGRRGAWTGPRPIAFWLRLLVVLCVVPGWAVAALLIVRSYDRERHALEQSTIAATRILMHAVDRDLKSIEATMEVLAASGSVAREDFATFHVRATEMAQRYDANVVLSLPSGRQVLNTGLPFGAELPPRANTANTRRALETGKPSISDVFFGPVSKQYAIAVDVPVVIDGELKYSLGMGLRSSYLGALLARQEVPADWVVSIIDGTGSIVARNRNPDMYVGGKASAGLRQRMAEVRDGTIEAPTLEGVPVFAAFSRSAVSDWSVAIGVPSPILLGTLQRSLILSALGTAAFLLVGAAGAHIIARRTARAIHALREPALALASGQPVSVPPLAIKEAAEVGNALEHAAELLARREADRVRAEATERRLEISDRVAARFRALLEAAPDAMIAVDPDGRIRFANARAERIFGHPASDLLGESVERLLAVRAGATASDGAVLALLRAAASPSGPSVVGLRQDGSEFPVEFPVELSLAPIDVDGAELVMIAARDVTARKQAEAEIEANQTQLAASMRLVALGTMAGGVAHEINNPLAVVHALASDLVDAAEAGTVSPTEIAASAQTMRAYCDRITKIVSSLRYLAREGSRDPMAEASVSKIVQHALDVCAARFQGHAVALAVDPIDPALRIPCREVQISQVVVNLLQNAFDAVEEHAGERRVRIEVSTRADCVCLSVIDTGPGVPPELKERIMEPFFTTKPVGKGTGLGLSLSKQIVDEHGGVLAHGTSDDGHTCFVLQLPLAPAASPS